MPPVLRAPSKDTLKFLRDAALYGSLGTTAGASVLLYEERRRMICTFQKVADNHKRINDVRGERWISRSALAGEAVQHTSRTALTHEEADKLIQRKVVSVEEKERLGRTGVSERRRTTKSYKKPRRRDDDEENEMRERTHFGSRPTGGSVAQRERLEQEVEEYKKRLGWRDEVRRTMSRMQNRRVTCLRERHHSRHSSLGWAHCRSSLRRLAKRYPGLYSSSTYPRSLYMDSQRHLPSLDPASLYYLPPSMIGDLGRDKFPLDRMAKDTNALEAPPLFYEAPNGVSPSTRNSGSPKKSRSSWGSLSDRRNGTPPTIIETVISHITEAPTQATALQKFISYHELRTSPRKLNQTVAYLQLCAKVNSKPYKKLSHPLKILEVYPSEEITKTFLDLTAGISRSPSEALTSIGQDLLRIISKSMHTARLKQLRNKLSQWEQLNEECFIFLEDHSRELLHSCVSPRNALSQDWFVRFGAQNEREALELIYSVWKKRRRNDPHPARIYIRSVDDAFDLIMGGNLPTSLSLSILNVALKVEAFKIDWSNRLYKALGQDLADRKNLDQKQLKTLAHTIALMDENEVPESILSLKPYILDMIPKIFDAKDWELAEGADWRLAKQLVAFLEKHEGVNQDNLDTIMRPFADFGKHDSLDRLSAKFESILPMRPGLIKKVCRSVVIVRPFEHAITRISRLCNQLAREHLVLSTAKKPYVQNSDRILEDAYVSILKNLWSTTNNIEVVRDAYGMMATTTNVGKTVTLTLSNLEIRARHGAEGSAASHRVNEVLEALSDVAERKDWDALGSILDSLHGIGALNQSGRLDISHPLVSIYVSKQGFEQAFSWTKSKIAQNILEPDEELLKTLFGLALKEKRGSDLDQILTLFERVRPDFVVNADLVGHLVQKYNQLYRPKYDTLVEMTRLLQRHAPELLSARIRGVLQQVRALTASRDATFEGSEEKTSVETSERFGAAPSPKSVVDQSMSPAAYWANIYAWYQEGEYSKIRTAFDEHLARGKAFTGPILDLTVAACLKEAPDNITLAMAVVDRAREQGINIDIVMGRLLACRISLLRLDYQTLRSKVFEFYQFNHAKGLPVSHIVTLQSARRLIDRKQPHFAAKLLHEVQVSKWAAQQPFDSGIMSTWMEAYADSGDLRGMRSVLLRCESEDLIYNNNWLRSFYTNRHKLLRALRYEHEWPKHFTEMMSHNTNETREWVTEEDLVHVFRHWRAVAKTRRLLQLRRDDDVGIMLCKVLIAHAGAKRSQAYWNTFSSIDTANADLREVTALRKNHDHPVPRKDLFGMLPNGVEILEGDVPAGISGQALHMPEISNETSVLIGMSLAQDNLESTLAQTRSLTQSPQHDLHDLAADLFHDATPEFNNATPNPSNTQVNPNTPTQPHDVPPALLSDTTFTSADPTTQDALFRAMHKYTNKPFYRKLVWSWVDWPVQISDDEVLSWRQEQREPNAGGLVHGSRELYAGEDWRWMKKAGFFNA